MKKRNSILTQEKAERESVVTEDAECQVVETELFDEDKLDLLA